jgi:cobalamin biosynthesis Mg chelatase CobN
MKRCLYVFTFVLLIFSFNSSVKATFLQSRSIKTCSNGVTYGYYERNGIKHWHVAKSCDTSSGWCTDGNELSGDPCPQSSVFNTTTTRVVTTRTTSRPTTTTTTTESTTTTTTELTTTTESKETTTIKVTEENKDSKEDFKENDKSNSDSSLADSILGLFSLGIFGGGGFYLFRKIKKIF